MLVQSLAFSGNANLKNATMQPGIHQGNYRCILPGILLALSMILPGCGSSAPSTFIEAESGIILGAAAVYSDENASGRQGVAYLSSSGAGVRVANVPESTTVNIRYAAARPGSLSVFINGERVGSIDFPSTGAWVGSYGVASFPFAIPANSDFSLIFAEGDTAMNVDRLRFFHLDPPDAPTPLPLPSATPDPAVDPDPIVDATEAIFGINADGQLFHVDEGWSASFHYLCLENDCRPGVRVDGHFLRDVSQLVDLGETVDIEFKVEVDGGQCLTGPRRITRQASLTSIESPCANGLPPLPPGPAVTPSATPPTPRASPERTAAPTPAETPPATPTAPPGADGSSPAGSRTDGAGLISTDGETITTRLAERFRDRHESDLNHDAYIDQYAQGSAYEIILIDRPEGLEVQVYSPDAPLSMVNFTYDHILNPGFADPPQFTGATFMAKGSPEGPANDDPGWMASRLYAQVDSIRGRSWAEIRQRREIVTLEFTPRRELGGNFPQYYSDILRYRAGAGGITLERDTARYFSAGPATNFAHGTPGFELSQPFLGIDQARLHQFTLGREIFRASFLGERLPGNGGFAVGGSPDAASSTCVHCHFQLGKAAPPGRADRLRQGFINEAGDLRVAPSLIGLGLLEAVDDSTIEDFARQSGGKIPAGRFGWKASEPTLRDQIEKAFVLDLGVENPDERFVDRIEDYIRGLGVPVRRHPRAQIAQQANTRLRVPDQLTITDPDVLDGERTFRDIGCAGCHRPEMQTGDFHPVAQFRNITIRPFTDLLLWNMGEDLCADNDEGSADRCEWRTAPLWGIRLQEWVTGHATFLHDGRATTLDESILLHGGDAASVRTSYQELSDTRQKNLLLYLLTL